MFAGETEREVYLPGGAWYDVHTGARHEGGQSVRVAVPLDAVGLFAREGAIVPLAEPVQYVAEDTVFRVTAHTYGKPCAPFMLFEDDATTFAYERGAANRVMLRYDGGEPSVERTGDYASRRYDIAGWEHHGG
jgi:alpha-D-xyloside xylohydrolase